MSELSLARKSGRFDWLANQLAPYGWLALLALGLGLLTQGLHALYPNLPQKIMGEGLERLRVVFFSFLFLAILARILWRAFTDKPESPLRAMAEDIANPARLVNALATFGLYFIFMAQFVELKSAMPILAPFSWDMAFAKADLWLHGGRYPHEWLGFITASPVLMSFINVLYHLWFFVMWAALFIAALQERHSPLRGQFLNAFFLIWVVAGLATAYGFSSAGPCYFDHLGLGPSPYAGLMATLKAHAAVAFLPAMDVQQMLWQARETGQVAGIAAFPSLHNAVSLLLTLAAFRISRWLGLGMVAFTAAIFIGSITLGWHYAVDAYGGWAIALLLWKVTGRAKVQLP